MRQVPPLIAMVGPTAAGKSALALALARRFGGEIVGADSRQVYRRMDIGTAKPTPEDRATVPHHLIDVVDPDEPFTLADYQRAACAAIDDILRRRKIPFLVGGTGLYVRAVLEGLRIPEVAPNPEFRSELEAIARARGPNALYAQLQSTDPVAAERIDARNVRRVIRALEVHRATGRPFSALQRTYPPDYRSIKIGLTLPRAGLYERIDRRIDEWIAGGLIEETRSLLAAGYSPALPSMSGIGYREIARYLGGQWSLEQAVTEMKFATHRFVRRQYAWFRLGDPSIHWLKAGDPDVVEQAAALMQGHLAGPAVSHESSVTSRKSQDPRPETRDPV